MGFPQRKYRVLSLSVGARRNRVYRYNDIVTSNDFYHNQAEKLCQSGHLVELNPLDEFERQDFSNRKIKLVISTMIWGRFDLFRFWASQINRLKLECEDFEIIPLAVGSEGDESRLVAESCGVHYYEFPNEPFVEKANARLRFCADHNPDYILFLGSDDIVSPSLLSEYCQLMRDGFDIIESKDMYFFDTESKQLAYCEGYTGRRYGEGMAVGRCISYAVAASMNWRLWYHGRGGMDSKINKSLNYYPFKRTQITIRNKHLILDIKGKGGINTFKPDKPNWHLTDLSEIMPYFDEESFKNLMKL